MAARSPLEELEQVRQRVEQCKQHDAPREHVTDRVRLLATIAEQTIRDADYIKNLELRFNAMFETATDLRAQLTASHNAALERAAAWHDEQYEIYRKLKNDAVADTKSFMTLAEIETVHELSAQAVRALMTKE